MGHDASETSRNASNPVPHGLLSHHHHHLHLLLPLQCSLNKLNAHFVPGTVLGTGHLVGWGMHIPAPIQRNSE